MRFNSPEHLEAWKAHKRFPAIHGALAQLVVAHVRGSRLLDLGCSYGLLGARIVAQAGMEVCVGVDADERVMADAREAGVPVVFRQLRVARETLPQLMAVLTEARIDSLVARRVLPELFGEDLEAGRTFVNMLAGIGVREVFIEGRVQAPTSVNHLRSIDLEVELLSSCYREVRRVGACSYLVAGGPR